MKKYFNKQNKMLQKIFYVRIIFTRKVHAEIFQFNIFLDESTRSQCLHSSVLSSLLCRRFCPACWHLVIPITNLTNKKALALYYTMTTQERHFRARGKCTNKSPGQVFSTFLECSQMPASNQIK